MTRARLMVREAGAREFTQAGGDFADSASAAAAGETAATNGNVEAFEVWECVCAKQRVWRMEDAQ